MIEEFVREGLDALRRASLVREPLLVQAVRGPRALVGGRELLSFCSNDYLGIAQDPALAEAAGRAAREWGWGAASSRALSGTTPWHRALEEEIAALKGKEDALLFPTGYMANLALVSVLGGPDCTVVSDELNHASLIDGCRLSRSSVAVYPHCDAAAAGRALAAAATPRRFVLTDTVFSMDGDVAPLAALRAAGADVVVDDVHGLGVLGPDGRGELEAPVQSGNLAKAAGAVGGFIAGSKDLVALLRSRARSFLFTTALPPADCAAGLEGLRLLRDGAERRARLRDAMRALGTETPIRTIVLGDNERALEASRNLLDRGFLVPAIRPPTVAPGTARLRLTVTAMHERDHVEALLDALRKI
jgi:8-amino-7-oxononanoate synthase